MPLFSPTKEAGSLPMVYCRSWKRWSWPCWRSGQDCYQTCHFKWFFLWKLLWHGPLPFWEMFKQFAVSLSRGKCQSTWRVKGWRFPEGLRYCWWLFNVPSSCLYTKHETFKAAPHLCLCDSCLSKYGSCEMFKTYQLHCTQLKANFLWSQYQTELTEDTVATNIGLIIPEMFCAIAASSTSADTVWFMKIVEKCVAAHDIEDDYGHKISQGQHYVVGNFFKRTRSTKNGLLFKEEPKKTYFFKESIVYPFVQSSTLKMELYLINNDFADILAFVEQTGMASLTSL